MTPVVSIIIPCFNEEHTIGLLLDAIYKQTFSVEQIEVVIADGNSTDGTREVINQFVATHADLAINLVDNPKRIIPTGLNVALANSQGEYIIRLDAHSIPQPDYVELCITTLKNTGAANVGGAWEIKASGDSWIGRSIAVAASHPLC